MPRSTGARSPRTLRSWRPDLDPSRRLAKPSKFSRERSRRKESRRMKEKMGKHKRSRVQDSTSMTNFFYFNIFLKIF